MNVFSPTRRHALGILAAGASAVTTPAAANAPAPRSERSLLARLNAEIDRAVREDDFSGAIMLAKQGRVAFARAAGLSSRDDETPNRIDTRFNIASIGKLFTATAILRLVDDGRLQLDTPFGAWLPDYPDADVARQVTLSHLLSHSSGLGNYWEAIAGRAPQDYVRLSDHLPLFQGQPLAFSPGSAFAYSNVGFVVLGLVIEAVTGRSFQDHVEQTLFQPLGMRGGGYWPLDLVVPHRATGFTRDETIPGAWRNNTFVNQFRGHSAGGAYATVADLIAFARAWREDRLFSRAAREEAARGRFDYRNGQYGLGVSVETINGRRLVGHSGGHVGIAGELMIFEDLGWDAVILTNGDVDGFWGVSAFVKDLLCGESGSTAGYRHTRDLVRVTAAEGLDGARALHARRSPGVDARPVVLEVEAAKARHRGQAIVADRLAALAVELGGG